MKYKKLLLSLVFVLSLSSCVGVAPDGKGYSIIVPIGLINTTVSKNFPQRQKTNYGTLLIDKPNILGKQGSDKLGVGTSFSFSNMLIPNGIKGKVSLSSGIRYNPNDRGLYLTSPMVDEIIFQNFSLSKYLTPQMKDIIGNIIAQQFMKKPIYHIDNAGASFIKNVEIANGNLRLTLGI